MIKRIPSTRALEPEWGIDWATATITKGGGGFYLLTLSDEEAVEWFLRWLNEARRLEAIRERRQALRVMASRSENAGERYQ